MSATSLITAAGARSRWALVYTGAVMAIVIVLFAGVVEYVAMPALAGLLIVIGIETVKPSELVSVYRTGSVQATVMSVTFVLTLLIPLQFSVLIGVGMSMILYIVSQASKLDTRRLVFAEDGGIDEVSPPIDVPPGEVVVLQPYGSLFFASVGMFEAELPTVTEASVRSVVILRFRGKPDVGVTLLEVLNRYSHSLEAVGSKLVIVTDSDRIFDQLVQSGIAENIGAEDLYRGTSRLTATVRRAADDGAAWIAAKEAEDDRPTIDETDE